ncbi:MAG: glucose-6-phosphate isomerase [Sphingomonadaceae bacterium]
MLPFETTQWSRLEAMAARPRPRIASLFGAEPNRLERLSIGVAGLRIDLSRLDLASPELDSLLDLAGAADLSGWRERLATGQLVNESEGRAATHMALRQPGAGADICALAERVRSGGFGPVADVIHIGIGGSALGPALLIDALGRDGDGPRVHVVSNIDGEALARALGGCDPARTIIVAVSKTFTTQETLLNLGSAQRWMAAGGIAEPAGRTIAVTAAPNRARNAGIAEILPFADSVGGRYSLWSAVGMSLAIRAGPAAFLGLLDGAHAMDRHFLETPFGANAPVLAALADLWHASFLRRPTRGVFAYDERLRLLPAYLQQLVMESNGKSAARDGSPVPVPTAPILWGGTGTDAQHAVFQLLHQGSHPDPVEFVAVARPGHGLDPVHHRLLLSNCFAQGAALLAGRPDAETLAEAGGDPALARQKAFPGNRPSSTILIDLLTPERLGALIAFHEARTFAHAVCLGINPFDQWGVELGKQVANRLATGDVGAVDPSTAALMRAAGL